MKPERIKAALREIRSEKDPTLKSLRLASLCSTVFRARGYGLVVVGGSAIEYYTDGAYTSGDLDLCLLPPATSIPLRERQEIMAQLDAQGGPRSWQVAGMFVDILGGVEKSAATPLRKLSAPYGEVELIDPEELLVERILVAVYPIPNPEAAASAKQLISVALDGKIALDWKEIRRLAQSPEFANLPACIAFVKEVADELKVESPLNPD